jgi:aspartate-semialdehyde dehydrogenase
MKAKKIFRVALIGTDSLRGKESIFIGQIKKEEALPNAFWIWTVTDNLTRGSALNAWEIAKILFQRKPHVRSSS